MKLLPRKLLRGIAYLAATALILLALLVGLVRLLLPLVPQYQEQVRDLATAAVGFDVEFAGITAIWPIRGPELQLVDVRLHEAETQTDFLSAGQVGVGISLWKLITEQRVVVNRVSVSGSNLSVVRQPDNRWRVQQRALDDLLARWATPANESAPTFELLLADISIDYTDERNPELERLQVSIDELRAGLARNSLRAEGRLLLPGDDSGRIDLDLEALGPWQSPADTAVNWRTNVSSRNLDFARLVKYASDTEWPLKSGSGRIALAGQGQGLLPGSVLLDFELADLTLGGSDGPADTLDEFAGRVEWEASAGSWLFAASNLQVARNGERWSPSDATVRYSIDSDGPGGRLSGQVEYLRLDDLYALVRGVATPAALNGLLPDDLKGEIRDLNFDVALAASSARYVVSGEFSELGIIDLPNGFSANNLNGIVVADQDGGRLELDGGGTRLGLPGILLEPVLADELDGFLVWRNGPDGLRILSDGLRLAASTLQVSSRFEVMIPIDGSGVRLDLDAGVTATDAPALLDYLPLAKFPPQVTQWLRRAVLAGEVPNARIQLKGPLRQFPYSQGEGVFRVDFSLQEGQLDFADDWPTIDDVAGLFVLDGIEFYTVSNSGRIGGLPFSNSEVRLPDLRTGRILVSGTERSDLQKIIEFLRRTPVANNLGTVLDDAWGAGEVDSEYSLSLPLQRLRDYQLRGRFTPQDATLGLRALPFEFARINGELRLENTRLSADGLTSLVLGEPVNAVLRPGEAGDSFSHALLVEGTGPLADWVKTFDLPYPDRFAGRTSWRSQLLLPRAGDDERPRLSVNADLREASIDLPVPLNKPADGSGQLTLDFGFPAAGVIELVASFEDQVAAQLELSNADSGPWQVTRGVVSNPADDRALPRESGVLFTGAWPVFSFDAWRSLPAGVDTDTDTDSDQRGTAGAGLDWLREVQIQVGRLAVLGQIFTDASVSAARSDGGWAISTTGPWAAGQLTMSADTSGDIPWVMNFERLWLLEQVPGDAQSTSDPRSLPSIDVNVGDLVVGDLRFGGLTAQLRPGPDGVTASPIQINGGAFQIQGDAAWLVRGGNVDQQTSRLRLSMSSSDLARTLEQLGFNPAIESEQASASGDLTWPGPPRTDFLGASSGQLSLSIENGSLLDVEPGGGRLLGLLSLGSLPRRLSLDFRDVVDEGFGFDSLAGDFTVESGDAYTCNLGLVASVADMAIIGRTGLGAKDYDQLAAARPHVSSALLTGGGFAVGGPGGAVIGALIGSIFGKSLSSVTEFYYEITGPWETASVEKIPRAEVDASRFKDCERLVAELAPAPTPEEDLVIEPGSALPEEMVP